MELVTKVQRECNKIKKELSGQIFPVMHIERKVEKVENCVKKLKPDQCFGINMSNYTNQAPMIHFCNLYLRCPKEGISINPNVCVKLSDIIRHSQAY